MDKRNADKIYANMENIEMKGYKLRCGCMVAPDDLIRFKEHGMSEKEIARAYEISRTWLYYIRKKLNCPVGHRSDKGRKRK